MFYFRVGLANLIKSNKKNYYKKTPTKWSLDKHIKVF